MKSATLQLARMVSTWPVVLQAGQQVSRYGHSPMISHNVSRVARDHDYDYAHVPEGNRIEVTVNCGPTTTTAYDADQMVGRTCDDAGGLLDDGFWTYAHDPLCRLACATVGGMTTTYKDNTLALQSDGASTTATPSTRRAASASVSARRRPPGVVRPISPGTSEVGAPNSAVRRRAARRGTSPTALARRARSTTRWGT